MEVGFETIGNATLICHDSKVVLVTDPWLTGGAYFKSWTLSHEIPEEQMSSILSTEYVWVSHGHPDHLSPASLKILRGKKILLPNHVGSRIYESLKSRGYDVHVLKDRQWIQLSKRVRVLCIPDYFQDAVLLLDINGRLLINLNDSADKGCWNLIKRTATRYKVSFLMCLSGFGDADMINYFDEEGRQILPIAAKKIPFGQTIAQKTEALGARFFIPFASLHRYQRKDSIWVNEYVTKLGDYAVGFESKRSQILPAFIRYNCLNDQFEEIKPKEKEIVVIDPEAIGDSWSEPLEPSDLSLIKNYFSAIESLKNFLRFANVRVAGKDHFIDLGNGHLDKGVTFEAPRKSFMTAVRMEIFDDLLIGNFMKTTLHGKWGIGRLSSEFTPYVAKYADSGRAKTQAGVEQYLKEYRRRAFFEYLRRRIGERSSSIFRSLVPPGSKLYRWGEAIYYRLLT